MQPVFPHYNRKSEPNRLWRTRPDGQPAQAAALRMVASKRARCRGSSGRRERHLSSATSSSWRGFRRAVRERPFVPVRRCEVPPRLRPARDMSPPASRRRHARPAPPREPLCSHGIAHRDDVGVRFFQLRESSAAARMASSRGGRPRRRAARKFAATGRRRRRASRGSASAGHRGRGF